MLTQQQAIESATKGLVICGSLCLFTCMYAPAIFFNILLINYGDPVCLSRRWDMFNIDMVDWLKINIYLILAIILVWMIGICCLVNRKNNDVS